MYTEDWFSKNIPVWEGILSHFKGVQLEALEIGSFEGRATVWICENILTHPDSHITCVDTFTGGTDLPGDVYNWKEIQQHFLDNTKPFGKKVELVIEDSLQYLKKRTKKADLIYIDGSHYAANCLIDGVLSHMLLKPNGIIIFDDYLWGGLRKNFDLPRSAIDAFMECFSKEYEPVILGYQVALRKLM